MIWWHIAQDHFSNQGYSVPQLATTLR